MLSFDLSLIVVSHKTALDKHQMLKLQYYFLGYLDRATFDKENFINRICILIFESTSLMTVVARMYPVENNLTSQSFQWYYGTHRILWHIEWIMTHFLFISPDDQLHRISKIPQLETGRYKPIVPSLPTTR